MQAAAPARAWVGLGSNLGDSVALLGQAAEALSQAPGIAVQARSSLYRTPPWGAGGQPDFINAVMLLETTLTPLQLLDLLQGLESRFGRVRDGQRWGPRLIDLDLLLYGQQLVQLPRLQVPHPHMHERAFVLLPLLEIQPDACIPGRGTASDCLAGLDQGGIQRLARPGWPQQT
jgi:2-amino-4-hydroxy-6-hydroxymethyldihydropteridine diphosphokinase